jgi:hypothetical protein
MTDNVQKSIIENHLQNTVWDTYIAVLVIGCLHKIAALMVTVL